jgi:hypothetical protein
MLCDLRAIIGLLGTVLLALVVPWLAISHGISGPAAPVNSGY